MKKWLLVLAVLATSWAVARIVDVKLVVSWQKASYVKAALPEQNCHLFVAGVHKSNYMQPFEECRAQWILEGYQLKPDSELMINIEL